MSRYIEHSWRNNSDDVKNRPSVIQLDNHRIFIISDADTDADGCPDAKQIDPDGNIETSLCKPQWKGDDKFVNSREIPYFVLPGNWNEITGIPCKLGDVAKLTYRQRSIYAIFADVGPWGVIGEVSICAIEALGGNPWNKSKTRIIQGLPFGVTYEIIPGSAKLNITVDFEAIQSYGQELFSDAAESLRSDEGVEKIPQDVTGAADRIVLTNSKNGSLIFAAYTNFVPTYITQAKSKSNIIELLNAFPNATLETESAKPLKQNNLQLRDSTIALNNDSATNFAIFFEKNYAAVRADVQSWFSPINNGSAVHNGCVAHQVSCLKLCGLPHPNLNQLAAINVDYFVKWALNSGWQKIDDMTSMKTGDICVSGSNSNLDHVYCFVSYLDQENALVLHNQVFGLSSRSLIGLGCGKWKFALRMPS